MKCVVLIFLSIINILKSNFIELHHLNMYKNLRENETRKLNKNDFAVLCSNCHRMIHKLKSIEGNKKDIEKLKKLYKK